MAADFTNRNSFVGKNFGTVRKGGLNEEEVRSYLEEAYEQFRIISREKETLEKAISSYRERENALARSLIAAQENALSVASAAEREAAALISNAKIEADRIIAQANKDAEQTRENTNIELDRELSRLYMLRDFELKFRSSVHELIANEKKRFEERFGTDELFEESVEGKETAVCAAEAGNIDLEAIYNDLPQTEDDLLKLINEL